MGHETAKRNTFEHLTLTHNYVLALVVIMLMTIAGYFFTQSSLEKQRKTSDRSQIASRQRIFCERIIKSVEDVIVAENDSARAFYLQNLTELNELFTGAHRMIIAGDERLGLMPESQEDIRKLLLEIRPYYEGIQTGLDIFLNKSDSLSHLTQSDLTDSSMLQMLLLGQAGYLNKLDDIILLYSEQLEGEVAWLQRVLGYLVVLVLIVLVCEGLFIFRPAVKKTEQAMIEKNIAIDNLTDEIENRLKVEERFGNLFLFSNDGIIIHTLSGYIIDVNKKFLQLTGFTRDEVLSKTIRDLQRENTYITNARARRELEKNGFINFEVEFCKSEGGYFNAEVSASVFHHNGMEVVQGIVRDVTERKESDEMNAALHRIAEKASFTLDLDEFYAAIHLIIAKLMYAGNFYIALNNAETDQIDIVYIADQSNDDDNRRNFAVDITRRVLQSRKTMQLNGEKIEKMTERFSSDVRRESPRELLAAPLKVEGRAIGAIVIQNYSNTPQFRSKDKELLSYVAQHIAHALERRQTLDDLATERRWLNATLSSITDVVITTDLDGTVLLFNTAAEDLSGVSRQTAGGNHFDTVMTLYLDEECTKQIYPLSDVLENGQLVSFEQVYLRRQAGGQPTSVRLLATPIRTETGQVGGAVIALHDISQRLHMEQALQKNERLESIGLLAAGIAHDFNNYLTAILGNISLAIEFMDQPAKLQKRLIDANAAGQVAKKLTDQLRDFSREGAPVMRAASIGDLVTETAGFVLRGRPVSLQYKIDEGLWPVSGDVSQLSRVVTNLLINADQAMPEGGNIIIECRNLKITEVLKTRQVNIPPGKYVTISVRDNGKGIAEGDLPRIFEMNYTTKKSGSGIGLATSRTIIEKHQGFMSVTSRPDEGTLFTIYLPASPQVAPKAGNKLNALEQGNGRILIMDDEEPVRQVISRMLATLGYKAGTACNGEEALQLYEQGIAEGEPFDLVILDLLIPGNKGGQETMTDLLALDPAAKGIVVSGNSHDPVMGEYQRFGFSGRMIKPFSIVDIGRVVKEVLN